MSGEVKKSHKVIRFCLPWLNNKIDDIPVNIWLTSDPQDPQRDKCLICPAPPNSPFGRTFSIAEGWTAITTHNKGKTHQEMLAEKQKNPNHQTEGPKQTFIQHAFKVQEELTSKHRKQEEQILEGQIKFSNFIHFHGAPSKMFTCFANLAPQIFPDSPIAEKWSQAGSKTGMRATKGDYYGSFGIQPHLKEELVDILRSSFFSVNFDESSVNSDTQLDVNVSYFKDGRVQKSNWTTISLMEGTSAEEIVEAVASDFESHFVPLNNIVDVSCV